MNGMERKHKGGKVNIFPVRERNAWGGLMAGKISRSGILRLHFENSRANFPFGKFGERA
jgi:hypothetical protein